MREIIIDCKQDEKNILLVENGNLKERYLEEQTKKRIEGNIYIGIVQDVLPGMQAAFLDINQDKNGFLHIKDTVEKISNETGNKNEKLSKYKIENYLKRGMPVLVQVKKDSIDQKGPRISKSLNIPGKYVVLLPDVDFITASQKIDDEKEIKRLKEIVGEKLPQGFGMIIRTSAVGISKDVIQNEVENLLEKYREISEKFKNFKGKSPELIYQIPELSIKIVDDLINQNIDRILVNNENLYNQICDEVKEFGKIKVELRNENLLKMYDLDDQIEKISNRKIWLKSGAFITIDKTEALTAIDVNTGKYVGTKDLEKTIERVNIEASKEIAKQIRLRDIGGIIIIDYIDMQEKETRENVINVLREEIKEDRAKVQIAGFTKLDLLEMTRKHMCS